MELHQLPASLQLFRCIQKIDVGKNIKVLASHANHEVATIASLLKESWKKNLGSIGKQQKSKDDKDDDNNNKDADSDADSDSSSDSSSSSSDSDSSSDSSSDSDSDNNTNGKVKKPITLQEVSSPTSKSPTAKSQSTANGVSANTTTGTKPSTQTNPFKPGAIYVRRQIHKAFGGQTMSGISTSKKRPFIFLFSHGK
jgi:hypothetical protein